jgi:hypothetical protein
MKANTLGSCIEMVNRARQIFRLTHASAKCDCSLRKADYRKSAIAVIAGHAVQRAARHSKVRRPMGVSATNHTGVGSRKSMQNAELV